ncbi:unnamed protein product [Boreogadus saida]
MDDELLILEVEKHCVLYDTSDHFYKDNTKRERAWITIDGVMKVDALKATNDKERNSEETEAWDTQQTSEAGCSTDVPQQQTTGEGNQFRRQNKRQNNTDVQEQLLSILQEPYKPPQDELDECHHFALSLVPILHRLDTDRRQQAKILLLQTLHNLEKGPNSIPPQHWQQAPPPPQFNTSSFRQFLNPQEPYPNMPKDPYYQEL